MAAIGTLRLELSSHGLEAILQELFKKFAFVERRLMAQNMQPHEAIRMLSEVMDEWDARGDPTWAMRSLLAPLFLLALLLLLPLPPDRPLPPLP